MALNFQWIKRGHESSITIKQLTLIYIYIYIFAIKLCVDVDAAWNQTTLSPCLELKFRIQKAFFFWKKKKK